MKKIVLLSGIIIGMINNFHSQSVYNYKGSGALNALTSWTLNPGGTNPPNFSSPNQIFVVTNVSSTTLSAIGWTVSGTNSEIRVGNGVSNTNLAVASNATLMVSGGAKLRVQDKGILTLYQSTLSNLPASTDVILDNGSTVNWAQSSAVSIWPLTYYNLGISSAQKNLSAGLTTVSNQIITNASLNMPNSATLTLQGNVGGTGNLNLRWPLGTTSSQLNITGPSTNSVNINLPTLNQQLGGFTLTRNARVKINKLSGYTFLGGNVGSSITTGTLDLSNTSLIYLLNAWNFGGGFITGSPSLTIDIRGSGALTGSILFEQTNSSTKSLNNLILNRTGQTLTLGNALDVYTDVNILAGTLASGGNLTLKSNNTQKARINVLSTSADVTGNVTVETFAKGGNTGWTNLAVAGVSGQTMASGWGDDFPMTCPSGCPNGYNVGGVNFTSVTTYNETNNTYPGISSGSAPITPGVGYWVYLGNGQYTTTDILIDVTGPIVKKNAGSWSFTKTSGKGEGWNLVGNPYPSPISFANAFSSSYGSGKMANELRVWNPDLNGGNGDYALYKVGVGSTPPVSSGGIDDNIPTGQGFYIVANQAFSVAWNENMKTSTASTNPLLRTINDNSLLTNTPQPNRLFYLHLTGAGSANTYCGIHFNSNASINYSPDYDAENIEPYPGAPQIFVQSSNKSLKIKGIPYPNNSTNLDVQVESGTSGTYQITLEAKENIPYGTCIMLTDHLTNTTHNLLSSPYTFTLSSITSTPRFSLNIQLSNLNSPITNIVNTPQCYKQSNGVLAADMGSGNYTFVWKDVNNQILKTTSGVSKDTLKNVSEGWYYVEVTDGACGVSTQQVQLTANIGAPVIDFTTNADTLPVNTPFQFTNNSQNLSSFVWYFGDGTTSTAPNPTHSYTNPGDYLVILEGVNACGDTMSIFKEISVNTVTGLNSNGVPASPNLIVSRDKKGYFVSANYTKDTKVNLMVTDILGRTLIKETVILGNNKKVYLNNLPSQQIVVIRAEDGYSVINQKIFVEE
jgi:hypothetical protein